MRVTAMIKALQQVFGPHRKITVVCIGSNSVLITGVWARVVTAIGLYKLYRQEKMRAWW